MARVRLLIADHNPIMRQTLVELLQENCDVVAEIADGNAIVDGVATHNPDVVLLGVRFEGTSGFEIARRLRQSEGKARIVIVSFYESRELVRAAFAVGVSGYVFASRLLDDLPAAIDAVCEGKLFDPFAN